MSSFIRRIETELADMNKAMNNSAKKEICSHFNIPKKSGKLQVEL